MVVECSCVMKEIVEKRREEGKRLYLGQFVPCLLLLIFLPRDYCGYEFTALQENRQLNMCISAKTVQEIENMALLIINHFSL